MNNQTNPQSQEIYQALSSPITIKICMLDMVCAARTNSSGAHHAAVVARHTLYGTRSLVAVDEHGLLLDKENIHRLFRLVAG